MEFQSQTLKVARYCVRKKVGENDVDRADWNPASGTRGVWNGSPTRDLETGLKRMGAPLEEGNGAEGSDEDLDNVLPELETRGPSSASSPLIPVPDSRNLPIQLPSSPSPIGAASAPCSLL